MESMIECKKGYVFNKHDKNYIVFIKSAGKNIIVPEAMHKAMMKAYIEDVPVEEISTRFSIPASYIPDYKTVFGWTRRGVCITDEDASDLSVEDCAEKLLSEKKFEIIQEFNKKSWKKTQEDALKWQEFYHRKFEPFEAALANWTPTPVPKISYPAASNNSDKVFTIFLSDLHYGASANSLYMFNKDSWSTKKTIECVDKFAKEIQKEVASRSYKFSKCVIVGLGDLIHSLDGKTTRGTELNFDCVAEEQFDYALDSLRIFIQRMVDLFGVCDVHSVGGNHNYETEVALFRALDMFFRQNKRVKFHHYASRPAHFVEGSTLIMFDHGADHKERAYVPPKGPKLEKHVNSLLLSIPETVAKCKSKIFVQADRHHFETIEYNDFEFYMFGTCLGSDQHASVNNLKNRPRQSCLVLDSSGVREVLHVYFD